MHPGNLLLSHCSNIHGSTYADELKLVILDTGICIELNAEDRKNLIILFKAIVEKDGMTVGRLMLEKSRSRNPGQVIIDPEVFQLSMQEIINNAMEDGGLLLKNNGISKLMNEVLLLCYKHRVRLESGFSTIALSVGVIEGLGIQLDPSADIIARAAPFIIKSAARDFGLL